MRKRSERSSASKAAQLEAKLDGIYSLLKNTGGASGLPADCDSTTASAPENASCPLVQNDYAATPMPSSLSTPTLCSSSNSTSSSNDSTIRDVCLSLPIPPGLAEKNLNHFRSSNLKFLPFLHIPPHITTQQLLQEKPFLWLCIIAVCLPGSMQREGLFERITELLHKELLSKVNLNMDILLGLMTYLSW